MKLSRKRPDFEKPSHDRGPQPRTLYSYLGLGLAATGAFFGDSALICGGEMPKECYSLKPDSAKIVVQMDYSRVDAASVKLNDTRYFKWE